VHVAEVVGTISSEGFYYYAQKDEHNV